MNNRLAFATLFASCILMAVGCDPVRTTRQTFRVHLADSTSGKDLAGVHVQMKVDFDRTEDASRATSEVRERARDFWAESPWSGGITDETGCVDLTLEETALDRSSAPTPPASRDRVRGKPFLIRVLDGHEPEDVISVIMTPGTSIQGRRYTITVLEIGSPSYVAEKQAG